MNTQDLRFLIMLDNHGELNVNPERSYAQFPGSARQWSRQTLRRLRIRGFIRPSYFDANCLKLTKLGRWKIDRQRSGEDDDAA